MRPKKVKGVWEYPHSKDVLAAAHLQPISYYIQKRRYTISRTIQGREVLKEYQGAERRRGTMPRLLWWGQEMGAPEKIITPAAVPAAAALPPRPAAQAQAPARGEGVVILDLRVIALMTSPAALAAGCAAPAPGAARAPRARPAPEEDAELDRAWAAPHVNDWGRRGWEVGAPAPAPLHRGTW